MVVQIFTEKFGMQSYIVQGVKKPKAKIRQNMLQPLYLVDMVVYHKQSGNIQRISELKQYPVLLTIPYDVIKSSVILFLNEVLYKAIKQQHEDAGLFDFTFSSIEYFDRLEGNAANFHLGFLLKLTRLLGFYPDVTNFSPVSYFDLQEGCFTNFIPSHGLSIEPLLTEKWVTLLKTNFDDGMKLRLSAPERKALLEKILTYYKLHIEGFGDIKSHHVLEIILN